MAANFIATPSLPVVTLSATGAFVGTGAEFTLPGVVTLTSTLVPSGVWTATPVLPAVDATASMLTGMGLTSTFTLYPPTVAGTLLQEALFSGSPALPVVDLEAQVLAGGLLTAAFSTPVTDVVALVISNGTFTAAFTLPKVQLAAEIAELAAAGFRTWVLNLGNSALTEYNNFSFNSYAVFNGQVLACGSAGVRVLGTQGLDGNTAITATVKTGQSDFDTSVLKRVPRLYVSGSQTGDMLFRTITSEDGRRTYRLVYNNVTGNQQRRVPVGKGPKSRYFQYEVENEAGADFSIHSIMAYPAALRRRSM